MKKASNSKLFQQKFMSSSISEKNMPAKKCQETVKLAKQPAAPIPRSIAASGLLKSRIGFKISRSLAAISPRKNIKTHWCGIPEPHYVYG